MTNQSTALDAFVAVLNKAHAGRVRQETLDFWRAKPSEEPILLTLLQNRDGDVVGGAAAHIKGKTTDMAVCVLLPEFEGRGNAALLLKTQIVKATHHGINYRAYVAEDNYDAVSLLEEVGLFEIDRRNMTSRKRGAYTQLVMAMSDEVEEESPRPAYPDIVTAG